MKIRTTIALCMLLLVAAAGFAQTNPIVTAIAGYTMSAFEDQESAAGTILVGASIGVMATPALEVGGEFLYPIGGYKFELETGYGKYTTTINQMMAGGYGKFLLGSGNLQPFIKGGVGYYMGKPKVEFDGQSETGELKSAIGFNVGGGIQTEKGLSVGFTYNIVKRDDGGCNTWAVTLGYQIVK
jgi:hypothetical protein